MDFLAALLEIASKVDAAVIFLAFLATAFAYYAALKNSVRSIFDPFFYASISSFFATFYAILLFLADLIEAADIVWVLGCTAVFYAGFVVTARLLAKPRSGSSLVAAPAGLVVMTIFLLFIANQAVIYGFSGIPLLMESRLDQFVGGSGFGIFSRISASLLPTVLLLLFLTANGTRWRLANLVMIGAVLLTLVLSGSKSALLFIFWARFAALSIENASRDAFRIPRVVYLALLLFVLVVLAIQDKDGFVTDFASVLAQLGIRVLAYGDVFSYSYVNHVIDDIAKPQFMALFYPLLQPLRLVAADDIPIIGFELVKAVYNLVDPNTGPNPRLPVYLDFFYNRWFVPLAFLFGALVALARDWLTSRTGTWVTKAFAFNVYMAICAVETDPMFAMVAIINSLLLLLFLLGVSVFNGLAQTSRTHY